MDLNTKKLTVLAFSDKQMRLKDKTGEFVLPVNPEKYEQSFKVDYDAKPVQGGQGTEPRFKSTAPEKLQLDFLFDGTGTVYGYGEKKNKTVQQQLDEFKKTAYNMEGKIHQPRFLKLVWKDFVFDCILSEMRVSYTLFDNEGAPIRAKLNCTFLNYKETKRRVSEEKKSSPDLTHVRTVEDLQSLPLLTHEIYGAPDYYLEIARANNLTSFRSLASSSRLLFPPLDKTES